MRKLLILLMMVPFFVNAQRVDKPGEPYEVYSVVWQNNDYFISIGSDDRRFCLLDDNGNKMSFLHESTILTYMSKRGWEFVRILSDSHRIFKKTILNDEEAYIDVEKIK